MSEKAEINCCTAWVNVHLAAGDCQAGDVVLDLLKGPRLRALLQSVTGSAPKRLDSLDGLTVNQKVMRVDWFTDALRASKKLPNGYKVDSKMISLQSAEHILPLLHYLMNDDITLIYEKAPRFMKRDYLQAILAEPLQFGPCKIAKDATHAKSFYTKSKGKSLTRHLQRRRPVDMSAQKCVFSVANRLLKTNTDGQRLIIKEEQDIVDSRVLCALVNALVPMTFPTEVLVNDRWTINLVLEAFSEIVGVQSLVNSEDLYEGTKRSTTALVAFVLMSGLQYSQAAAVVERMEVLCQQERQSQEGEIHILDTNLEKVREEICWIQETYNHSRCKEWTEQAKNIRARVQEKIDGMIHSRFCQVTVPRPMTINKLTASLVINLSLTGWCGFYLADSKENLWPNRRLVVQDKKTGEYFEDFSGYDNHRGAVRDMLGLHPYEIVEVNPSQHPDHLIYLESASRNRMLKANTRFLYQVFPGTSAQCRRQLLRAARIGELDTVKKLLLFFKRDKEFVNGRDTETGNTALHIASRQGHLAVMMTLLESEADVDPVNNAGSTPFFLATEGLHKTASLLLLEWGADIHVKNRLSKTALDLTRNSDLKVFLSRKYLEYQELQEAIRKSDCRALEGHIDKHVDNTDPMASLNSRCVGGGSLLHAAASTGSLDAVKYSHAVPLLQKLLGQEVRPDIRDEVGATPLHITRDPAILQEMFAYDGDVNSVDSRGNSPLHCLCSESRDIPSLPDCVSLLVGRGASLNLKNHASKLPIHCAAAFGLTPVIDSLVTCGATVGFSQDDLHQLLDESTLSSLPYLAITGNHLRCSQWLVGKDFLFRAEELDELLVKLLLPGPNTLVSELKEALRFVVEQGADVNILCKKGNRPLHLAAALTDHPDLVEVLLEAGADPNIPNSSSATPLIIACQSNNLFSASILLQRGASFSIKNAVGKCAFEYISDFEEWIQSGLFSPDIVSQLRGFKLRQGKELVSSLSKLLNSSTHLQTYF